MRFISFLIFTLATGCTGIQHTYHPPVKLDDTGKPEIIFLSFHIKRDSLSGKNDITLISRKTVSGKVKGMDETSPPDRLVISLLDTEKKALMSVNQEHPLIRSVETVSRQGEFERKAVNLSEADFFVRMPLNPAVAYVLVEEILSDKKVASVDFSLN